jgi:hypothetical protein
MSMLTLPSVRISKQSSIGGAGEPLSKSCGIR